MNDFSQLENELKQLRPAAPSDALVERVGHALSQAQTPAAAVLPRPEKSWGWLSLGLGAAAIAAAVFLLARPQLDKAPSPSPAVATAPLRGEPRSDQRFTPEGVTRVVYGTRDEGLIYPRGSAAPVRRMRAHSLETLQWRDRQTGASLRVSYPTEEVELIPVSGQ